MSALKDDLMAAFNGLAANIKNKDYGHEGEIPGKGGSQRCTA
jgi:hypothetical protein